MPALDDLARRLDELHDSYVYAVNAAVEEDRDDLVFRLADDYFDDALRLLTGSPAA